jgi:hypothetical protein
MGYGTSKRLLAGILAITGPALLAAWAWTALTSEPPWSPGPVAQNVDKALERKRPDVVVIGPSLAWSDTDEAVLGAAMGDPPWTALRVTEAAAPGAEWYAMLKYHVLAAEHLPKLVIIIPTMTLAWTGRLSSAPAAQVSAWFPQPDEILVDKAFGGERDPRLRRLLTRRTVVWKEILDAPRGALVGALFRSADAPTSGLERAERAADSVFKKETTTGMAAAKRFIPVVEEKGGDRATVSALVDTVEQTFLPDIHTLTRENGIALALAFPPALPGGSPDIRLDEERERAVFAWARDHEIAWIDLRNQSTVASDFIDGRHMTPVAARSFSRVVAERVLASGILGNRPLQRPRTLAHVERTGRADPIVVPASSVRRVGDCELRQFVPALAGLSDEELFTSVPGATSPLEVAFRGTPLPRALAGQRFDKGCHGAFLHTPKMVRSSLPEKSTELPVLRWNPAAPLENNDVASWWVYPGSGLAWRWDEPWSVPDNAKTVHVSMIGFGSTELEPWLTSEGRRLLVPVVPASDADDPGPSELEGELLLPPSDGPFSVEIVSPHGGPVLLVRDLTVTTTSGTEDVVQPRPARTQSLFHGDVTYDAPPPEPEATSPVGEKGFWYFPVKVGSQIGCCPYVVVEDGQMQPMSNIGPFAMGGIGTPYPKVPIKTMKATESSFDPTRFQLAFRPDRRCTSRRWLLPGDVLHAVLPKTWPILLGPVRRITLLGRVDEVTPTEGEVSVRFQHAGFELDDVLSLDELLEGRTWAVPPTGWTTAKNPWTVEIRGTVDLPPILLEGTLSDG